VPFTFEPFLAAQLHNNHLGTTDPIAQQCNLFATAVAHIEANELINKMSAKTSVPNVTLPSSLAINGCRGHL